MSFGVQRFEITTSNHKVHLRNITLQKAKQRHIKNICGKFRKENQILKSLDSFVIDFGSTLFKYFHYKIKKSSNSESNVIK